MINKELNLFFKDYKVITVTELEVLPQKNHIQYSLDYFTALQTLFLEAPEFRVKASYEKIS